MARPAAAARLMIVLAFLAVPALAQEPPPGLPWIESYGVADYQGHKQNWDVAQGPDGLLYVAGGSSLLVFDGVDWRRYGTPNNGRIRSFQVADDGRIWVGSEDDFGWFERDAAGGLAFHSLADRIPASQRPFGDVRQVVILDEQVIFQTTGRLFHWADGKLSSRSPWGNRFRIVFVHNGRLFVLVDDAIYPLDGFDDEAPGPAPDPRWPLAPGTQATFLLPWDGDTLLLGTYADGLFLIDSEGPRPFNDDAALATAWPYTAERMADGSLAVGTIHGGLFQLDATGRVLVHLDSDNGLPVDTTLGLGLDHQGGLWLSQENAITRIALASPLRRYGESFGLTDVEGIARVDGHWMFAGSGGLAVHDPGAGELRFLDVPQNELFGLLATASGVLLAGSNGVYQVDIDFEAPAVLAVEPVFEDTFSYDVVASRHRPVVYVGTESGLGLIERVDGRWVNRGLVPGVTQRADTIAEDGDGRVWVGTGTGVVQALEWGAAQVPEVTLTLDAADGVPAGNAWVFSFGDDVIFATTEGGYRLSADTPPR
ncbi:MAG: two-component regulator propeller domain-containing protein, partial [Pseudomonadota bacterium]